MTERLKAALRPFVQAASESPAYGKWRGRLTGTDPPDRLAIPSVPAGVKFEITHSCNLQCPFCYTDSPRRTRERALDLGDAEWMRTVEDSIALGAVEAVVTGGEPLLRRELALSMIERLSGEGLGTTLNTNGWFLDEEVCDRLSACPGIQVNVSLDGGTPGAHDAIRGIPGSWRRAVEGIDRLLRRSVRVQVVSVVTPANQYEVGTVLEVMWLLGVPATRLAVVIPTGAAARSGDWKVKRSRIHRTASRFQETHPGMQVKVNPGTLAGLATVEDLAPASILIRPNGILLMDSARPFAYGNVREGLGAVWDRIQQDGWRDAKVVEWAQERASGGATVAYLDDEVPLVPDLDTSHPGEREATSVPEGVPVLPAPDDGPEVARSFVKALALSRRYRRTPGRVAGDGNRTRVVRVAESGRVFRLNGTAGIALDSLDGGTPADLVSHLAGMHPSVDAARLEHDALSATRLLLGTGSVEPDQARVAKPDPISDSANAPASSVAA